MRFTIGLVGCLAVVAATTTVAQEAEPTLSVELNRIDTLDGACRLTFMVENGLEADLDTLSLETVLIDRDGRVDRLTLFDFGALPAGIPRVRQFDIPGLGCAALGRVLINGVNACGPAEGCADALHFDSRTDVDLIG
jgi:hypothetical protein